MISKLKISTSNKTENCDIFPIHPFLNFIKPVLRFDVKSRSELSKLFAKWVMSAFKIEQTANTDIEAIPEAIRDLFR